MTARRAVRPAAELFTAPAPIDLRTYAAPTRPIVLPDGAPAAVRAAGLVDLQLIRTVFQGVTLEPSDVRALLDRLVVGAAPAALDALTPPEVLAVLLVAAGGDPGSPATPSPAAPPSAPGGRRRRRVEARR